MVSDANGRTGNGGRLSRRVSAGLVLAALVLCAVLVFIPAVSVCATEPISEAAGQDAKPRVVHVDASGAARLIAEGKVVVLDIRTPGEFAAGHFGGATNIDFHARDFADRLAVLDRNQTYLLHCASGRRSRESLTTFEKLDFKAVVHLDGGIRAWKSAGHPVELTPAGDGRAGDLSLRGAQVR
ncbi:MAG: rhodanese-like domain-containing protein [Verrucomicrobia bacterium]|nr:rhodanese-like domain-containing protein [Verrucomicrobiota bacterium]